MRALTLKLVAIPSLNKGIISRKSNFNFSPSGKKDKPLYKYVYDEKYGCPRRVLTGKMDLQAFIQESCDNVDFKSLGKMLIDTKANIIDHFISKDGEIIDVSGQPRNIHEASRMMIDLQDHFDSLPSELKVLFDNDFDSFRASYKNGTLGTKLDSYYKSVGKVDVVSSSTIEKKGEE